MKFELTPTLVGWALVFSVPPGLGATLAVNGLTNQPITSPDALAVGGGVAVVLFSLVVVAGGVVPDGEREERRRDEKRREDGKSEDGGGGERGRERAD